MTAIYPGQPRPFDNNFRAVLTPGVSNQACIAAPGAGLSIYIQMLGWDGNATAGSFALFHPAGGGSIGEFVASIAVASSTISYPGGWKLPTNTALVCDCGAAAAAVVFGTYLVGPSL